MGRKAQKEKGRKEGSLSPQSPRSFPFSGNILPLSAPAMQASVKSLLAGATLACLTEVIFLAFFRLGRHFSCMHAYWCIDSYAPISANKIWIHHCIYFPVNGLEYQYALSQVHVLRSYTRKVYLKIGSLRRKRDLNHSLVLSVAQAMKGALNLKRHFATVFVIGRHPLYGKWARATPGPDKAVEIVNRVLLKPL